MGENFKLFRPSSSSDLDRNCSLQVPYKAICPFPSSPSPLPRTYNPFVPPTHRTLSWTICPYWVLVFPPLGSLVAWGWSGQEQGTWERPPVGYPLLEGLTFAPESLASPYNVSCTFCVFPAFYLAFRYQRDPCVPGPGTGGRGSGPHLPAQTLCNTKSLSLFHK